GFFEQIVSDGQLKTRFRRVDIENSDPFVGDKLSPDLRSLVNDGDLSRKTKVILQSDDIQNPEIIKLLAKYNVRVESRAENLNMMVLELPIGALESLAALRGAKHISMDRQLNTLGH